MFHTSVFFLTALIFASIAIGIYGERLRARWAIAEWKRKRGYQKYKRKDWSLKPSVPKQTDKPFNDKQHAAEQLQHVMSAVFVPCKLLNFTESRLLSSVEKYLAEHNSNWRVMAQVSLGEILSSKNKQAYLAINSKRVDLLLIDTNNMPRHVIEYQGGGHHQGNAAVRDAVKKEALRRAGINYSEICKGDTQSDVKSLVEKIARDFRFAA